MPVTLGSAGITFSDATSQTTKGVTLGAVQVSGTLTQSTATYHVSNSTVVLTGMIAYINFAQNDDGSIAVADVITRVAYRSIT
jgi:hypothetical protein